ncbi:hypothetical protein MEX01_41290 [Methylorubrum extorquens]|nr:hypothetical protein MEX01_41290 [Methylorubrum extorquens]
MTAIFKGIVRRRWRKGPWDESNGQASGHTIAVRLGTPDERTLQKMESLGNKSDAGRQRVSDPYATPRGAATASLTQQRARELCVGTVWPEARSMPRPVVDITASAAMGRST